MKIESFNALVFQINMVDAFAFLDNRGRIFSEILNLGDDKLIENSDTLRVQDDNAEYVLGTPAFAMKLKPAKLLDYITNDKAALLN